MVSLCHRNFVGGWRLCSTLLACVLLSHPAGAQPLNERFLEQDGVVSMEAESGRLGASWLTFSDPDASGNSGIEIDQLNRTFGTLESEPNPDNIVTFDFALQAASFYEFWFRFSSSGGGDDSFFWRIGNSGPWITQNGQSGIGAWFSKPIVEKLAPGEHTLQITYRENGSRLDKFVIQQTGLLPPAGDGPDESLTLGATPGSYAEWLLLRAYENPLDDNRPDADPRRLGLQNLIAYALDIVPEAPGAIVPVWLGPIDEASGTVDGFFRRTAGGAPDVTYQLEVADDLGEDATWDIIDLGDPQYNLRVHESDPDGDASAEIMRFTLPVNERERLFVVLRVLSDVIRLPEIPQSPSLAPLSENALDVRFRDAATTEQRFEIRFRSGPDAPWQVESVSGLPGTGNDLQTALFGLDYGEAYEVEARSVHAVFGATDWVPVGSLVTQPVPASPFTPEQSAARFLTQATMGPTYGQITALADRIRAVGELPAFEEWLDAQFAGDFYPFVQRYQELWADPDTGILRERQDGNIADMNIALFTHLSETDEERIITMELRKRINYALIQILVVGVPPAANEFGQHGLHHYYDTLGSNAFGNYRDVLFDVTMNPRMGLYLSHLKNQKADPTLGTNPDENYAREIMQLFSIGLFELNPDGTRKTDANGEDIPTYTNLEITEFAEVFTGLAYQPTNTNQIKTDNGFLYAGRNAFAPMYMYDKFHDFSDKHLLNGTVLTNNGDDPDVPQEGLADIHGAVDNLFTHSNVGPFIGRLLIQQLVTSNPSPAYISRVTDAFNGDGPYGTVRGDMRSVIKAILLDPEAREYTQLDNPHHGKLTDPYLRLVQMARAYEANSGDPSTERIRAYFQADYVGMEALRSPSVFNFFLPDFQPTGPILDAGLVAPEFQLLTDVWAISIKNAFKEISEGGWPGFSRDTQLDLAPMRAVWESGGDEALVDRVSLLSARGLIGPDLRSQVLSAIGPLSNPDDKVALTLYLINNHADAAILR